MNCSLSRREFLHKTCLANAIAGATVVGLMPTLAQSGRTSWVTSIRDVHLRATGEASCWEGMKRLGVAAVEVQVNDELGCPGLFDPGKTHRLAAREDREALRDAFAQRGAQITALCLSNRLEERLEREVACVRSVAEAAEDLGVRVVRIDVVPSKMSGDQFLPFAIDACKRLCEAVQRTSVRLGIENHGRLTNDPAFLQRLFDGVGSDRLGLTLDAMNFYWFGHPLDQVYAICETFAPKAFHTHCKNLRYPEDRRNARRPMGWEYEKHAAPVYEGDIDYARVTAILRKAGYEGDLCLENECLGRFPKDQHVPILAEEIAALRKLA
ncbi:MAG: sugar phosphate isomerase/epimerase family protein [Verrucomicrobiia bacterium]